MEPKGSIIEQLYPILKLFISKGISIETFNNLTPEDIRLYFEMWEEETNTKTRNTLSEIYLQAELVASFVNCGLNGKKIPSIYDLFPDYFEKPEDQIKKEQMEYEKKWLEFAAWNNERRKEAHR